MFLTNINNPKKNISQVLVVIFGLVLSLVASLLVNKGSSELAWVICACLAISFWSMCPESLFCYWLACFPLADYLIRYPEQQAVITCARIVVMLLSFGVIARLIKNEKIKLNLGCFELSWMLFALYALANCLMQSSFSLSTLRTAVDGFILPLILFVIVRHSLDIKNISDKILVGLIMLAYLILPVGLYELKTGIDLLAYPGGELFFDGRIRPNGPFLAAHSYALISLILGLTLVYWPKVANIVMEGRYKILWRGAVASAFLSALIPQFRAVMLAMVVCVVLGQCLISGWRSLIKPFIIVALLLVAGTPIWLVLSDTKFYQQRIADTANLSSRIMTYKRALEVAQSNPMGVGLGNYENYFNQRWAIKEQPEKEKLGELTQSTPHSNFLSVLAELGIIGLILYLVAHLALIYTAWKTAKHFGHTSGVTVILLVIAYAGVGLTLTSGYYYDLNLFFFCCLGMLLGRGVVKA